jgi:hypothetical protein
VQVATFQQQFPQTHRSVVGVGEEGVLDDDAPPTARFENFDEPLQKQVRGFARADREVLLDFFAFLAAERWIG